MLLSHRVSQRLCLFSLQYLHNEKKLLHGDMKSCNVVIKGDFETVKICDVGVSLQLDENMRGNDCVHDNRDKINPSSFVVSTVNKPHEKT